MTLATNVSHTKNRVDMIKVPDLYDKSCYSIHNTLNFTEIG